MTKPICGTRRLRGGYLCLDDIDDVAEIFAHEDMACGAVWKDASGDTVMQWLKSIKTSY